MHSELWNAHYTKSITSYQQFLSQTATNWITLQQQRHNFILIQVHWCLLNLSPPYLSSKYCLNSTMYSNTQGVQNIHIKRHNAEHYWSIASFPGSFPPRRIFVGARGEPRNEANWSTFQYQDLPHYNSLSKDTNSLTIPAFQSPPGLNFKLS